MTGQELDEIVRELYVLPPTDFVAARNELVRQARAAGSREIAERLQHLRRPTRSAWLVNLLARDAEAMQRLSTLGRELREAQTELAYPEFRQPRRTAAAADRRPAGPGADPRRRIGRAADAGCSVRGRGHLAGRAGRPGRGVDHSQRAVGAAPLAQRIRSAAPGAAARADRAAGRRGAVGARRGGATCRRGRAGRTAPHGGWSAGRRAGDDRPPGDRGRERRGRRQGSAGRRTSTRGPSFVVRRRSWPPPRRPTGRPSSSWRTPRARWRPPRTG